MPGKSPDGIACGNHIVNCARGGIVNENDIYDVDSDKDYMENNRLEKRKSKTK